MDIKIPKLVQPLDLGGYAPELSNQHLYVWVDPPRAKFQEITSLENELEERAAQEIKEEMAPELAGKAESIDLMELLKQNLNKLFSLRRKRMESRAQGTDPRILAWYSNIWSQKPGFECSVEKIAELENANPAFYGWLVEQTWKMIVDNRERNKKK